MVSCFCGIVDRRKAFSIISSQDHCQRSSPSRISDTTRISDPAKKAKSFFVFIEGVQLYHNQVLVLKDRTFHRKVLSRLYRNGKLNIIENFNLV